MSVILETKQLCKFYGAGENQVKAVNQVDIRIEQGEFVAIVGKSGSGKLCVCINTLFVLILAIISSKQFIMYPSYALSVIIIFFICV